MKILKYALAAMVLLGGVSANAQNNSMVQTQTKVNTTQTPGERAAQQTAAMTEALSLTAEQVENVQILNLKVANKIQAIKDNDALDAAKKIEFIYGNKKDHLVIMRTILTDEQLVTYEAWLSEKKVAPKN
ncbi:MAG: putative transglutaminase-like cysteine proteinase [Salibacteraceae bacterium]|jgi:predicted transglutaminase-like cysteine proteinase